MPALSLGRPGATRAGEVRLTQYLHNPAVTDQEMALTVAARTGRRCRGVRHALATLGTTVL